MINQKKAFINGMNGDDSPKLIGENESLNIMNARVSVSEYGRDGRVENVPGTTLINQSVFPPYGTNQTIGSAVDIARNRIIYFHSNTVDDSGIYCYDIDSGLTYAVLYDSQVTGGLGFSRDYRIDRNARVVGDLLYWTDYNNQPRRINIEAGIKMNHASYVTDVAPYSYPMNFDVITIIRKPPVYPITYVKETNIAVNSNLIKNNAFRFCYFFYYRDGEQSTLSPQSLVAPINSASETYNQIALTIPLTEIIEQDVQSVNIVVIYSNGEKFFTIKTWDKNNASDLAEINAHNAGTTALNYDFTNDSVGIALNDAYKVKPFDTVPILSKTLEYAQNRIFLGTNTIGYDTPTQSSLQLTVLTDTAGGGGTGNFIDVYGDYSVGGVTPLTSATYTIVQTTAPVVIGSTVYAAGFYYSFPVPSPLPASIDISTYTYIGADDAALLTWIATQESPPISNYNPSAGDFGTIYYVPPFTSVTLTGTTSVLTTVLKSDASYEVSIVFYDEFLRSCGVVQLNDNKVTTPDRAYNTAQFDYAIQWSLSNASATSEIPSWAKYYSIVASKNFRTNFFIQARAGSIVYATKNSSGEYVFTSTTYASTNAGVALKLDKLVGYGIGYTFQERDVCKVYLNGVSTVYSLSVLAQDGEWIVCELKDLGNLTSANAFFEIYTPKIQSADSVFYEIGQMYLVANYGTNSRQYTTLTGTIVGDVYLVDRNDGSLYRNEAMSPNDTLWQLWFTSYGRPQFIDRIGQQVKSSIKWSNTFLPGTVTNGLSSFDALDEKILPLEMGELNKLQLAQKVSEEGKIMLAICRKETASLYLGEVQLVGSSSNAFVASSPSVIGTINILQGSFGTINPETVVEFLGLVFWLDALNGVVVQYSSNGLFPVSSYKQSRFFKRYCANYIAASSGNLDNINGFHHIPAGIDPFHKEYLITLPALIYENYAEVLPSYGGVVPDYATSIINRFDIYDQLGKTMAFSFEENHWGSNYEYMPEMLEYCQNTMFGWRNGNLYQFNSNTTNWNTFFGVEYPVRICIAGNPPPSVVKDVYDIAIEGSNAPDYTVLYTELPNEQITDLVLTDYTNQENIFYARFFRDRLSPNATGTAAERMYKGDVLKSVTPFIMMEFQQYDGLIFIDFVDVGYAYSRGQLKIAQ